MRYKVIVFDFFGVLCSEVSPFWLAQHFGEAEARRIKAGVVHAADLGDISQEEMLRQLGLMTNTLPQQILEEWFGYVRIDPDALDAVRQLRAVSRVALLTNSPSEFVRSILMTHKLEEELDCIVVSSEERCAKPDPEIFELLLERLSVPARAALLVDDNPANVAGAIRVGMDGIVFSSMKQLKSEMPDVFAR